MASSTPSDLVARIAFWGCLVVVPVVGSTVTQAAEQTELKVNVGVRFLAPDKAEIRWESNLTGESAVAFGPTRKLGTVITSSQSGTQHAVVLDKLQSGQRYFYRIGLRRDGKRVFSPFYEFDGRMNYTPPTVQPTREGPSGIEGVIEALQQPGGYAVLSGEHADVWAPALAAATQMSIIAACEDQESLNRLRHQWYASGDYGIRLSAQPFDEVPKSLANLIVTDSANLKRMQRFLSPRGTMVCLGRPPESELSQWMPMEGGIWVRQVTDFSELAEWGHQYGSASNTSYAGESLGGVDETSELAIRWLGRPGADFGIDRNPRMPAPLAVGGRLFHQGMNRMIALDAFNGAVLWSIEIPDLRRVNIPRDCSNWCADSDHVYAATRNCLWVIDGATGEMLHTMQLPDSFQDGFDWGYVAVTNELVVGSAVKANSAYEDYWAKAAWYDTADEATTSKVCGSGLVVYDKEYGDVKWQRDSDAMVHSTITISDDRIYFVEAVDPDLRDDPSGKLTNQQIWKRAMVRCLDISTGDEIWSKPVPAQSDDQVVAFGIADDRQFLLETSSGNQFQFASFDSESGEPVWSRTVDWPSDNHGAHMQHAVLMNGKIFVQPHVIDAVDGQIVKSGTLGKRRGCATPIGAGGSIIYRGGTGPLSLWSLERESPTEFTRLRPSCWLSTIPAQGMLFSPEAGGGCSCGGWMECSIGFAPEKSEGPSK